MFHRTLKFPAQFWKIYLLRPNKSLCGQDRASQIFEFGRAFIFSKRIHEAPTPAPGPAPSPRRHGRSRRTTATLNMRSDSHMLFFFLFLPVFSCHWSYHIAFLRCSGHNRKVSDARAILFFLFVFTVRFLLLLLFLLHCVSFISEQDSSFWFSRRPFTLASFLTFFKSTRLPSISSYPLHNGALRVHGLR